MCCEFATEFRDGRESLTSLWLFQIARNIHMRLVSQIFLSHDEVAGLK